MRRRFMIRIAAALAGLVALAGVGGDAAAMDQAKHDDIKALLELTGALNRSQAMIDFMVPALVGVVKKANPNIPQSVLDLVTKDVADEMKRATPELEEPMIAIYDANFTDGEIKAILAFDRSPVGQKLIAQQPQILQQSMAVGQVWGKSVAQRAMARLRDDLQKQGYKL